MKTMTITVVLAVLVGSAQAQNDDPVNQLFYKVYEEFGERYRVAAVALACERKGIAESVKPERDEVANYLMDEIRKFKPGDLAAEGIAVTDIVLVTAWKLDGYYLGHVESQQIMFSVTEPSNPRFKAYYCEEMLNRADALLAE